jgi:hypothetical protein
MAVPSATRRTESAAPRRLNRLFQQNRSGAAVVQRTEPRHGPWLPRPGGVTSARRSGPRTALFAPVGSGYAVSRASERAIPGWALGRIVNAPPGPLATTDHYSANPHRRSLCKDRALPRGPVFVISGLPVQIRASAPLPPRGGKPGATFPVALPDHRALDQRAGREAEGLALNSLRRTGRIAPERPRRNRPHSSFSFLDTITADR